MADPTAAPEAPEAPPAAQEPDPPAAEPGIDWKAEARKHEREAKKARSEVEQLRQSQMTEQEKAVAEAKAQGRTEALAEAGSRLVDAEVRAAFAGRRVDVAALLQGLDRKAFLGDDGQPDTKAIAAWADQIAPASAAGVPDLGQGARGNGGAGDDMNSRLRRAAGRA